MFAIVSASLAAGPAFAQAFPILAAAMDAFANIPGMLETCLTICNALNNPLADFLFEAIFS